MKNYLSIVLIVMVSGFVFTSCSSSAVSASSSSTTIGRAIDTGSWTFTVNIIRPQAGRTRQPNGLYTFTYTPGNLNVYLPYFGRVFGTADVVSGENPLNFISKDFEMKKEKIKNGKWRINFIPKDFHQQVQQFSFLIFENGTASLDVIMTNRSPISYNGDISAEKK